MTSAWLEEIQWTKEGLVPAIAQDTHTQRILMMAWMNREALLLTVQTHIAHYWSRSRQKIWQKGETSGHTQHVHALYLDCDADAIMLHITQVGGIACHTGRESCFYRQFQQGQWVVTEGIVKAEDI